ncbi:universal stress protein [Yoonia sp. 208BN28-4]|uniref:universal stress protein n=1 Tax=Yoonia sp. 208BN28-4 TaxID=3126505 RepID=UPI0030A1FFE3
MFSNIIVGLDGSAPANNALLAACDLAKTFGAKLTLVHAPHPETVAFAMGAVSGYHAVTTMPPESDVQEAAQKVLDEGKALAARAGCEVADENAIVRRGDSADELLAVAQQIKADLIVTGRRGLGNIAGLVMGSTSQRVAHLAHCAVLSVPHDA